MSQTQKQPKKHSNSFFSSFDDYNSPLDILVPEFEGVADAVADHVISAQNLTLYNTLDKAIVQKLRNSPLSTVLTEMVSSSSILLHSRSNSASSKADTLNNSTLGGPGTPASGRRVPKLKKKSEVRFKIALSGGSLIKILHQGLLSRESEIDWGKWDIYFADERLVPFDSPDSNYGSAKREIFDLIQSEVKPRVYHIDELLIDDPQECADSYEKILIDNFAKKDSVKLPMFDLLLLAVLLMDILRCCSPTMASNCERSWPGVCQF